MQDLAAQSALPVAAEVSPERLPPAIEATAYFVVSEALTNAGSTRVPDRARLRPTSRTVCCGWRFVTYLMRRCGR